MAEATLRMTPKMQLFSEAFDTLALQEKYIASLERELSTARAAFPSLVQTARDAQTALLKEAQEEEVEDAKREDVH